VPSQAAGPFIFTFEKFLKFILNRHFFKEDIQSASEHVKRCPMSPVWKCKWSPHWDNFYNTSYLWMVATKTTQKVCVWRITVGKDGERS
jgi:hypothetical protein